MKEKEKNTKRMKSVGKCPICGKQIDWFNDIPLYGFCWGTKDKPHKEFKILVPKKYNPYL